MKLSIDPALLKRAVVLAKVIKPKTNDFNVRLFNGKFTIFAYDDRRHVISSVQLHDLDKDFDSGEYFLSPEKLALFESDLKVVTLTVDDNSIVIKATDDKQSRSSILKRRSSSSKRLSVPDKTYVAKNEIDASKFEALLKIMSCSAQVKESKTDDDIRMNQVHFYSNEKCAISNARYYGTVCKSDCINFDFSIPGIDMPLIRSFINKCKGSVIGIDYDTNSIKFIDTESDSVLLVNFVQTKRPAVHMFNDDKFESTFKSSKDIFLKNLNWSLSSIEGTQRIKLDYEDGNIRIFSPQNDELCSFPVSPGKGGKFSVHLPARFLISVCGYCDGDFEFHYNNPESLNMIGIHDSVNVNNGLIYMHYLTTMQPR